MKKILIVNNNMKIGGVQKSLYNLLWSIKDDYDITLFLFKKEGEYVNKLPESIKIIECESLLKYLAISQKECSKLGAIKRGILNIICKIFGRPAALKIMLASQKSLKEEYDCAIAFLHNGRIKSLYGGVQEFVLYKTKAKKKIAFLHCDYKNSDAYNAKNNKIISRFDEIAACSEGCKKAFIELLPDLENKCSVVKNCHRFDEINILAENNTVVYDKSTVNIVVVSRVALGKGVERTIEAVSFAKEKGFPVKLHIVGDGAKKDELYSRAEEEGKLDYIYFYGEQANPFRMIKNADLLMLTSFHEAAPMVIEEAESLGVPVLATKTTSSEEMVIKKECGWVCENNQQAINELLLELLEEKELLLAKKEELIQKIHNNVLALKQFEKITEV